jgi:hypothetical protein
MDPDSTGSYCLFKVCPNLRMSIIISNKLVPILHIVPAEAIHRIGNLILQDSLVVIGPALRDHGDPHFRLDGADLHPLFLVVGGGRPGARLMVQHPHPAVWILKEAGVGDGKASLHTVDFSRMR